MNLAEYDISNPYVATVVSNTRLTVTDAEELRHIVLAIPSATFNYLEGQSIGVLVPGPHPFGNEYHFRLYSIANARQGEEQNMAEISICVRRCFYIDDASGERYPGIASNYLCDSIPGQEIRITGPYGRQFMAPRNPACNLLMMGVGTGIAPFRAFLKHIYEEHKNWKGKVRLFYGARTGLDLAYMNDQNREIALYYDQDTFKAIEALSPRPHADEPADMAGAIKKHAAEVWELIQDPKTYCYVSGLSRLEGQLDAALAEVAGSMYAWMQQKQRMIQEKRWSTLLYD